jgi:long-chain fatty acid transport protein
MKKTIQIALTFLGFTMLGNAQGFYWTSASARSAALGGIYVPSSSGPLDALAVNPAGLTSLDGRALDLNLTAGFLRGSFTNSVNAGAPLVSSPGVMPYGAFGTTIGKSRFSLAVGEVPELTSVSEWNYVDAPGVAGATYGLQHQKSAILATRSAAGVGVWLGPRLSIGATVGAVYNSNTLQAPYIFQSQPVVAGLKTLLDLRTTGVGWNTSVGALVHPSQNVQLGLAWKSSTTIDSTGDASGTLAAQLAAIGLAARPDYHYNAAVHNVLPQSVVASANWRMNNRWLVAFQADWINWKRAFRTLPVALTNGNNADVNGLLNSTSLNDTVPLDWKDQYSVRVGFERLLREGVSIQGGFAHSNNPVPSSTLSPLTAAIFANQISTGLGYTHGRTRFDAAYSFIPTANASVAKSGLLSGEYNNSTLHVGAQAITLSTSFRF